MSDYIRYEAALLLLSAGTGAALLLIYEFLAALRKVVPHHPAVTACEDLVYWTVAGIFLFSVIYRFNQGILRGFFFGGCICGAWLCRITIAVPWRKALEIFFGIPVFIVKFSTKRLLFFIRRCNILVYIIRKMRQGTRKRNSPGEKRSSCVEKIKKAEK
ncbi:MAG TPA: spore cortex biosynthesis protein YabQ [Candidatus Blautia faecipullorum]|nr:spore cortex biosynthesis protein YabQ [Candidatus Blautia faecipullorum]